MILEKDRTVKQGKSSRPRRAVSDAAEILEEHIERINSISPVAFVEYDWRCCVLDDHARSYEPTAQPEIS